MTKHDHSTPIGESSARIKALQAAMRQIEKDFGQGSVMFLGQQPTEPIEVIPTGSMALNAALGIGGYPRGRIVEIYGGEASGKTTLALHAIARYNAREARHCLSMQNTPLTHIMPRD